MPRERNIFSDADRISDHLVDLWYQEIAQGTNPIQILCGFLLGYMALQHTMPPKVPESIATLTDAVVGALSEALIYVEQKDNKTERDA
jgi:hypothetical protein